MAEPRPIKQGWKDAVGEAKTPAKAAAAKKRQIFTLLFALLALAGATVAFLFLLQRANEPFYLPLCITEYKDRHIPANAGADQDRDALLSGKFFPKSADTFASQEKRKVDEELRGLKNRKPGDALVFYLNCHVMCDPLGELCLLPGDASVDKPDSWIKLHDVLESIRSCPSKQKLLILDIMRPLADPRLGVLANDSADRVQAALDQVEDKDRLVLCACAPGQTSLTSEEMGQSVFGFYLDEGLRGWADGFNPEQRTDGRVTVRELAQFVRTRVDRWATRNRNTRQTPVLLGASSIDFPLVVLEHAQPQPPKEAVTHDYPAWLRAAWELRDQWWVDQTYRLVPRVFRQLEATVLRAEQHWRGGVDPDKIQREFNKDMDDLKKQASAARALLPRPDQPRSLAQAVVQGKAPPPAAIEELRKLILKLETLAMSLKPEEFAAARVKMRDEFSAKLKEKPPFELAYRVFEVVASDTTPQPERIGFLYEMLSREQPVPQYVETLFLRRLTELSARLKKEGKEWPVNAVRRGLHAVREGERAAACDPRVLPWIRDQLDAAAQKRHDGETLLFTTGYASPDQAVPLLEEAYLEFRAINSLSATLQEASRRHDTMMTLLPGIAPYLMNRPELDSRYERYWKDAVGVLRELRKLLDEPPSPGLSVAEVRKKIDQLQQKSESLWALHGLLTKPFAHEDLKPLLALVTNFESGNPAQCNEIDYVLDSPLLKAKERQELWSAGRKLAGDLHERTRRLDKEDQERRRFPAEAPDFDAARAQRFEQDHARRRAELAIDLLRLGGFVGADKLDVAFKSASRGTPKPAAWPAFGAALRHAWATQLPQQFLDLKDQLPAQDRLSRVVHPFDVVAAADLPSAEWQRRLLLAQWKWLGECYRYQRQDLLALGERMAGDFYDDAARDYLREVADTPLPSFQMNGGDTPNLRNGQRFATYLLKLDLAPSAGAKAVKDWRAILADSDWLRVSPEQQTLEGDGPFELSLNIELKSDAEMSATLPPQGFLLAARVDGRSYHHKVNLLLPGSKARQPQILVSDNPRDPGGAVRELHLRPNARQAVFVFVRNPADQPRKLLVELKTEGHPADGSRSELIELGGNETKRVAFPGKSAAGDKDMELPQLKNPLTLRLLDVDNKRAVLDSKHVSVSTGSPRDYVQITQAPQWRPEERKLTVKLKARQPLSGQPCRVKLELPRERIAGFLRADSGTFEGDLPPAGEELTLTAEGLQFVDNRFDENGYIYLTVDGYERAFIFRTTFVTRGSVPAAVEVFKPELRLRIPPFARPDAPLRTRIEVDNAPSGVVLDVLMDRNNTNEFAKVERLVGDRRELVRFTPAGPDGSLLFKTTVEDWSFEPDTRGIVGPRPFRVVLLDKSGREILSVTETVVLDMTSPANVRIAQVGDVPVNGAAPVAVPRASALTIRTSGEDRESGIKEVLVFWGEPIDGKIPPGSKPVLAEPLDEKKTRWTARLPLPADKKGENKFSVQFLNGVGQSTFETAAVDIKEKDNGPSTIAKKGLGKIAGTVLLGTLKQPNLTVVLLDDKNMPLTTTRTDDNGAFVFKDVKPGTYKVTSSKDAAQAKGMATVSVSPDETASVQIELFR